jgi:hypothetical protein
MIEEDLRGRDGLRCVIARQSERADRTSAKSGTFRPSFLSIDRPSLKNKPEIKCRLFDQIEKLKTPSFRAGVEPEKDKVEIVFGCFRAAKVSATSGQ